MVTKDDVIRITKFCDVGIYEHEIAQLTEQLSDILEFWSILDELTESDETKRTSSISNIFREDTVVPSFSQEQALSNRENTIEGYFKAPRVM